MKQEMTQRRIRDFASRYGRTLDERQNRHGIQLLAAHAALPVILNADLVHLLRINFLPNLPYTAEAYLLLSPLCSEIGGGLYEMGTHIREVLLRQLVEQCKPERLSEIATLLWKYSREHAPWSGDEGLEKAQELTALNFIDLHSARAWLDAAEGQAGEAETAVTHEWYVAMRKELEYGVQVARRVALLQASPDELLARLWNRDLTTSERSEAVYALGKHADGSTIVAALLKVLIEPNEAPVVRIATAETLGRLGSKEALPALVDMLRDSQVRRAVANALRQLGWQPTDLAEQVYDAIARYDWETVRQLGSPAIPVLGEALRSETDLDLMRNLTAALEGVAVGETERSHAMKVLEETLRNFAEQRPGQTNQEDIRGAQDILSATLQRLRTHEALPSTRGLHLGMRGASVRTVQEALRQRGYRPGPADGIYGRQTVAAVQAFQRDQGLRPDGEVDDATLAALRIAQEPQSGASRLESGAPKVPAIFVSYAHADQDMIHTLRHLATVFGDANVFVDTRSLRAGDEWQARLREQIDQADIVVLLWSDNAAHSDHVRAEWQYALERQKDIRPVYWQQPLPPPPPELAHLHFAYIGELDRHTDEKAQAAEPVAGAATVVAHPLNLRGGPGTNFPVLSRLQRGQQLTLLGRSANNQWLQVRADDSDDSIGMEGWVAAQFVETSIPATSLPFTESDDAEVNRQPTDKVILWVDDQPSGNTVAHRALQSLGAIIVTSTSTEEALEYALQQTFALIISDMSRPGDSQAGYTLLEHVRRLGVQAPLIIYSGTATPEQQQQARQRGAYGQVNSVTALVKLVVEALSAPSVTDE